MAFALDRKELVGRLRDSFSVVSTAAEDARVHSEVRSQRYMPDINISLLTRPFVLSLSCSGMRRKQVPANVRNGVNRTECI